MGALKDWANENWVDIGAPKKDGKYQPCGRKNAKTSKRKYPKCVPAAKAAGMSKSQKASAVRRKRAKAQGVGGKPTMVKTKGGGMAKKKFPDLSGDGKVTQKDILMGRGVVKKAAFGKAIRIGAKAIAKKKGKSKKEINKMFDEVKNTKADVLPGSKGVKKYLNVLPGKGTNKLIMPAAVVAVSAGKPNKNKAKSKRKEDKISKADIIGKGSPKGRAQGGSVKGKDKYGEYTSKLVKKGKNFNLEERTYTKGKKSAKMRTYTPSRLFDSTGELRQLLGMESKASQADIIGKGKGRAKGGSAPAPKVKKDQGKKTLESLDRAFKKKPKKKKDLIDEIQPDRIFTPGVKGPLRKVSKGGMMVKGQGAAIRGTKFKGTF